MKYLHYILLIIVVFCHCIVIAQNPIENHLDTNLCILSSEDSLPLFPMPKWNITYDTIGVDLYYDGQKANIGNEFDILLCFSDTTIFAEKTACSFMYPSALINKDSGKIIFRYKKTVCPLIPFGCNPSNVRNFKNILIIHYSGKKMKRHISDSCFKLVSELHVLSEEELLQEFIIIIHGGTFGYFCEDICKDFRKIFKSKYKKF